MIDHRDQTKPYKIFLGIIEAFNGLSGLLGGFMLMRDPSGASIFLKLEWLDSTPFSDYLFPGAVLFTFIGLGNIFGLVNLIFHKRHALKWALLFGLILMVWIIVQVSLLGYLNYLQPLYFVSGLIQFLVSLFLLNKKYDEI
jgi:hypothetical protein